jgi:alkaline phosphatase D
MPDHRSGPAPPDPGPAGPGITVAAGDATAGGGATLTRRRFLEAAATAAAGAGLVACTPPWRHPWRGRPGPLPPGYTPAWPDGVASGDPAPFEAVLWSRLAAPASGAPVRVLWEVAEDPTFRRIVTGGVTLARTDDHHTLKVRARFLRPDRWYHYRFTAGASRSPVGRLRTAPLPWARPERLRFAFASCQQINDSLYVAHRSIGEEPDLDFFMHLGDYVYVSDTRTLSLTDYRAVYDRFKANPLLQYLQARLPLVATWDDGEFYNGVDRLGPPERLAAAKRAWIETMPVIPPPDDPTRIDRGLVWGRLADLYVCDLRSYRDPAVDAFDTRTPEGAQVFDPNRTTLGARQKRDLLGWLERSRAAWHFLGMSYPMGPWRLVDLDTAWPRPPGAQPNAGVYAPREDWDDYQAERRELLTFLATRDIRNTISCAGQDHLFIATELQPDFDDPGSPTVAFDVASASLTADPDLVRAELPTPPEQTVAKYRALEAASRGVNPFQKYLNFLDQGYVLVDVTPARTVLECKAIDTYHADAQAQVVARITIPSGAQAMEVEAFPGLR